jgi:hypothetical protein
MFRKEIGESTTRCDSSRPDRSAAPAFLHHTAIRPPDATRFWAFIRSTDDGGAPTDSGNRVRCHCGRPSVAPEGGVRRPAPNIRAQFGASLRPRLNARPQISAPSVQAAPLPTPPTTPSVIARIRCRTRRWRYEPRRSQTPGRGYVFGLLQPAFRDLSPEWSRGVFTPGATSRVTRPGRITANACWRQLIEPV